MFSKKPLQTLNNKNGAEDPIQGGDTILYRLSDLEGYTVRGTDGEVGQIEEFYFDSQAWVVRYAVVNTGGWLLQRKVLISAVTFGELDLEEEVFLINLTQEEIKNSPEVDADQPISRQKEENLCSYYDWPLYWNENADESRLNPTVLNHTKLLGGEVSCTDEGGSDPHLRSSTEIETYHVESLDGELGQVEDLLVEEENWTIRYMAINTGNRLLNREVYLSPDWIQSVSWRDKKVKVALDQDTIEKSPETNAPTNIDRQYEKTLYAHYGYPTYWR